MRYKSHRIIILFLIVLGLSVYFIMGHAPKEETAVPLTKDLLSKLQIQQSASASMLERSWGNESLFNPINVIEGSKDEYVTFYVYQTAFLLGQKPGINYCQTLLQTLQQDSFAKEHEGLIFTGIERVFRAQKSMELCDKNKDSASLLKKYTKDLLDSTYISEGYFISDEFKAYKDKPEYTDVKIQQTFMMLYLASNYGLLEDIDNKKIKSWVDSHALIDFPTIETVTQINEILGYETNYKIENTELSKLVNLESYTFNDLLAINSLTTLHKKKYLNIENSISSLIIDKLKNTHFGLSDIQSEYFKMNILKNLNSSISSNDKEILLKDFTSYMYDDGTFPTISSFNNPFSPALVGRTSEEYTAQKSTAHDKIILKHIKQVDVSELVKQDPFEVYSYVSLLQFANGNLGGKQREELVKFLLTKVKMPIERSNIINWSYYTKALLNLEGYISADNLPKNTEKILDEIIKSQKSYFGSNDEISTLVFLDTLASTDLYIDKIKKSATFINKVEVDTKSEIAAYLIYYKTSLIEKLGLPYDKNITAEHVIKLFRNFGYALNSQKKFHDIYSTYLLMNTNHLLTGDYNNE